MKKKKEKNIFLIDFTFAGIYSIIAQSSITPISNLLYLIKNNDQIHLRKEGLKNYKIIRETIRNQGFYGLTKGNRKFLFKFVPRQALNFAFFKYYRRKIFKKQSKNNFSEKYILSKNMISGSLAGISTYLVTYPFYNINKNLLEKKFYSKKNIFNKKNILNRKKILNIFKNLKFSKFLRKIHFDLITVFPYTAVYFGLFNSSIYKLEKINIHEQEKFLFANFVCLMAEIINYPLYNMKNKIKLDSGALFKRVYLIDLFHCYFKIDQDKRAKFFYKGFFSFERVCNVLRGSMVLVLFHDFDKYELNK